MPFLDTVSSIHPEDRAVQDLVSRKVTAPPRTYSHHGTLSARSCAECTGHMTARKGEGLICYNSMEGKSGGDEEEAAAAEIGNYGTQRRAVCEREEGA